MARRTPWLVATVAAMLVFFVGLATAQLSQLSGTARDTSGGELPGVTVSVNDPQFLIARTTKTDMRGRFAFADLPSGEYIVTFSLMGFEDCSARVSVSADKSTTLDVAISLRATAVPLQKDAKQTPTRLMDCRKWPPKP